MEEICISHFIILEHKIKELFVNGQKMMHIKSLLLFKKQTAISFVFDLKIVC
jgi:hypothetical protein